MKPETRQRLLQYAQELVDRKVSERTYFAGNRTTITDRLISLQLGQPSVAEEPEDIYIRVWAEFSISQVSDPPEGYDPLYPYPSTSFTSPAFPVFTLLPPSRAAARQNQLDQMEYYLTNAGTYFNATALLYANSNAPLVLAPNNSAWGQDDFPPFAGAYPGFPLTNTDLHNPYLIGGPADFFDFSTKLLEINTTASATLYVRGHTWETLGDFSLGGSARSVRLTTRQVGSEDSGGVPRDIISLQDDVVPPGGSVAFNYSPISTAFISIDESVSLVGFELL
jgi:hypothetical protein